MRYQSTGTHGERKDSGSGGKEPGDWEEEAENRAKGITGICDE